MFNRILALVVVGAALTSITPAATAQPVANVEISAGAFRPQETRVDRGGTVNWLAREPGHSVVADDGRFDFGTINTGETRSFAVGPVDEVIGYYCRVHGRPTDAYPRCGMCGRLLVGDAQPPPPPPVETPDPPARRVPSEYSTIGAALDGAPPSTVVEVASGVYAESVTVTTPGVTIRGAADGSTAIDGAGTRSTGVFVVADDVQLEDLTVRRFVDDGVVFLGVDGFVAKRIASVGNGQRGFLARRARGGSIIDSSATGAGEAAFKVEGCADCDVVLARLTATESGAGYWGDNAGGVALYGSVLRRNGTGVVVSSDVREEHAPQQGTHVVSNTIEANNRPAPGSPSGIGVLVRGGWFDVVEANVITGHDRYGVAVSGLGFPAYGNRIVGNVVAGSRQSRADLAWDGFGMNVCFSENDAATTDPPFLEMLYSCDRPLTVGVPQPLLAADLIGVEAADVGEAHRS